MRGVMLCHTLAMTGLIGMSVTAAQAMPAESGQRAEVRYADLDLGTKAGQKELNRRIRQAARTVCGMREVRTGTRLPSLEARDCYDKAMQDMIPQFARALDKMAKGA